MAPSSILATFPGANILRQTPDTLRSLIANATAQDMDWQPAPDRWSINMVLAHLADVELKGFVSRFRAIAEPESPFLPSYDQLEQFRSAKKFDGRAELKTFAEKRRDTLAWLDSLPASVAPAKDSTKNSASLASANCSTNSPSTTWGTSGR